MSTTSSITDATTSSENSKNDKNSYLPDTTTTTTSSRSPLSMTSLGRRYNDLFRMEKHCDCVFHFGSIIIKSHKLILSAASPVFDAMFYGPLREETNVNIFDINSDIFYILLNYIYSGTIDFDNLTLESVIELYYAAEKYLLNELISNCLNAVKCKLRFTNILPALEFGICMELQELLNVCMNFFTQCCLTNLQFMAFLKENYFHVSKDCIMTIIKANKDFKYLIWYVYEWCRNECDQLNCKLIIDDLKKFESYNEIQEQQQQQQRYKRQNHLCNSIERCNFKACRPFKIDDNHFEWNTIVKCDRFIGLLGIVINSRLMPSTIPLMIHHNLYHHHHHHNHLHHYRYLPRPPPPPSSEYSENLCIEIYSLPEDILIMRHSIEKQKTSFNCDMNIFWDDDVILSPDVEYRIKLIWGADSYGGEYPCSLQSNLVDGIKFCDDLNSQTGSLFKGLKFFDLV